jgi:hypothetical protein
MAGQPAAGIRMAIVPAGSRVHRKGHGAQPARKKSRFWLVPFSIEKRSFAKTGSG